MTTALARRPAASLLAEASGEHLPAYVTREQARAIINAASSQSHRLMLECLWQSGGRISEVLRLRPYDVDLRRRPDRRSAGVGEPKTEEGTSTQAGLCVGRPGSSAPG